MIVRGLVGVIVHGVLPNSIARVADLGWDSRDRCARLTEFKRLPRGKVQTRGCVTGKGLLLGFGRCRFLGLLIGLACGILGLLISLAGGVLGFLERGAGCLLGLVGELPGLLFGAVGKRLRRLGALVRVDRSQHLLGGPRQRDDRASVLARDLERRKPYADALLAGAEEAAGPHDD